MHACPPYYILVLWPVVGIHRVYIQLVTRCWQLVGDNYVLVVVVVLFIYNNNCKMKQTTQGRQRKPTSLAERTSKARRSGEFLIMLPGPLVWCYSIYVYSQRGYIPADIDIYSVLNRSSRWSNIQQTIVTVLHKKKISATDQNLRHSKM